MHDWQIRVVDEKQHLDIKLAKLEAFLAGDDYARLSGHDRDLLRQQASYMRAYSSVLAHRIERFSEPDEEL